MERLAGIPVRLNRFLRRALPYIAARRLRRILSKTYNSSSPGRTRTLPHLAPQIAYALALCLAILNLQSCGTGQGIRSAPPPHVPSFTSIDAPGAQIAGSIGTRPWGINADGVIVGYFSDVNQVSHGFVRSASGTITTFDAPNAATGHTQGTFPAAINSSATIVGDFTGQDGNMHGFTRSSDGSFALFDVPSPAMYTVAFSINDSGDVTGYFGDINGALHGFVRTAGGTITTFDASATPTVNSAGTIAHQIDANGNIVGVFYDNNLASHGFVRASDGTITVFDAPGEHRSQFRNIGPLHQHKRHDCRICTSGFSFAHTKFLARLQRDLHCL